MILPSLQHLQLMSTSMSPQKHLRLQIVSITFGPGDMILRYIQSIKILISINNRIEIFNTLPTSISTVYLLVRLSFIFYLIIERGWLGIVSNLRSTNSIIFLGMFECDEICCCNCDLMVEKRPLSKILIMVIRFYNWLFLIKLHSQPYF